ncbi:MAG: succinylglutamate desuccinylase/aspartoacylase family protein, partial [Phycisphaerales bacterium]
MSEPGSIAHDCSREHVAGVYDAGRAGPTLLCVGRLHANEPAGLEAALRVIDRLERERPDAMLGRVVAIAGNIRAVERSDPDLRSIDRDLNRVWTDALVERVETAELATLRTEDAEVREISAALRSIARDATGPALLVDLHTTSADSPPFVFIE